MSIFKSSDPMKRAKQDLDESRHLLLDEERNAENHRFAAALSEAKANLYRERIVRLENRLKVETFEDFHKNAPEKSRHVHAVSMGAAMAGGQP